MGKSWDKSMKVQDKSGMNLGKSGIVPDKSGKSGISQESPG